jgi:ABC-type transport system substrate-binding protein
MYTGKYEMALWQMLGGPTIQDFTWNMYHSGGSNNPSGYNKQGGYQNPEAEKLLDEIVKTNDPAIAKPNLIKLQNIIFDDVPVIFANWRNHRTARNAWVKNFKTGKLKGMEDLREVWLDK